MPVRSTTTLRPRNACAIGVLVQRAASLRVVLVVLALAACTPVGRGPTAERGDGPAPPPTLSSVTAPPIGRATDEIRRLAGYGDHPGALLRTAFLLQEQGDWNGATTVLNRVLFADLTPDREVEALDRYLRGRAFAHAGDRDRASHEWGEARRLASDPALVARIDSEAGGPPEDRPTGAVAVETPAILPRTAWRAAAAKVRSMRPMSGVRRITVHHSATLVSNTSMSVAIGAIRGIQRHHQAENGWGDIGYHFLIDPAGRVWTGRALEWQGAHAGDNDRNDANIGICLLGNFVKSGQGPPPAAQVRALEQLVTALCVRYHVDPKSVLTHQELKTTTECPGPYVQTVVERIRERLPGVLLAAGVPAPR